MDVLTMNLTQYASLHGELKHSGTLCEMENAFGKIKNFKIKLNFDWMKMKIGR